MPQRPEPGRPRQPSGIAFRPVEEMSLATAGQQIGLGNDDDRPLPGSYQAGGQGAHDTVTNVLGGADDHGVGVRLRRDPGELEQGVPVDRAELSSYPCLGYPTQHQLL